jgi:ankyrin repeat protein
MDPLSFSASLIAVIGAASTAAEQLERLRKLWTEAPDMLFTLSNDISDLELVLNVCKRAIQDVDEHANLRWRSSFHLASQIVNKAETRLTELAEVLSICLKPANTVGAVHLFKIDRWKWIREGSRKATRIQMDLRKIKEELVMLLDAAGISATANLHLSVHKMSIDAQRYQEASQVFNQTLLQQLHGIQSAVNHLARQQMDTSNSQQALQPLQQIHAIYSTQTSTGVPNMPSLNPETPDLSIQLVTRQRPCKPLCSCRCHLGKSYWTPQTFEPFIGRLTIGYNGLPWPTMSSCSEPGCQQEVAAQVRVRYQFPRWWRSKVFTASLGTNNFGDPELLLRTRRVVPWNSPAIGAIDNGSLQTLRDLLTRGQASPYDEDINGDTLLHRAAFEDQLDIAHLLLFCGADMEYENRQGWNFHDCVRECFIARRDRWLTFPSAWSYEQCGYSIIHKIVIGLISLDLEEQLRGSATAVNDRDRLGRTPLHYAAFLGDISTMKILMKHDANPSIADNENAVPLHQATYGGYLDAVSLLIEQGVNIDVMDDIIGSPLHHVANSMPINHHNTPHPFIKLLTHAGAKVDFRDNCGRTPFMDALDAGNMTTARAFLENGADINAVRENGQSALAQCISSNRRVQISLLLDSGADYQKFDKFGNSILHLAAQTATLATIEALHYAKLTNIDVDAKNYRHYTAQELAVQERSQGYLPEVDKWHSAFKDLIEGIRRRTKQAKRKAWRIAQAAEITELTDSGEYAHGIAAMFKSIDL